MAKHRALKVIRPPALIHGNAAIARGAIAAGCRFFAGYPITPATEIAEIMSREMPRHGGTFIQMEDEIASMGAIVGASLAGVKAMTATSGPGFCLMQEILGFAYATETPCVVVNVMRGGPSTGLPTRPSQSDVMLSRWGAHGNHASIVLAVSSVEDCFHVTLKAFNFSEKFRTPVILLSDEVVAHTRAIFSPPEDDCLSVINRVRPSVPPEWYIPYENTARGVPPMAVFGDGYRHNVTGLVHDVRGFPTEQKEEVRTFYERIHRKIDLNREEIELFESFFLDDADICLIAYGSASMAALEAVHLARKVNLKVGLLKLTTLFPFPSKPVEEVLNRSRVVIVPEMNFGQIVQEVKNLGVCQTRIIPMNRYDGHMFTPSEILQKIREVY